MLCQSNKEYPIPLDRCRARSPAGSPNRRRSRRMKNINRSISPDPLPVPRPRPRPRGRHRAVRCRRPPERLPPRSAVPSAVGSFSPRRSRASHTCPLQRCATAVRATYPSPPHAPRRAPSRNV
ncbi:hypothetical protein ABMA28_013379 [Loxostege sticticalis]|uniref:Uncharacterized protein n=1 Tax=Loxostege sticticalis TaxID=481309 RepID=A0ABD0TI51_LOXSC